MQIAVKIINLIFILTLLLSCDGNVGKVKDTETPQGLNPLIGTEWVHSDDTDPESINWFNVYHSPFHFYDVFDKFFDGKYEFEFESPAVIKFLEDGRIREPTGEYKDFPVPQFYRYSYNEPYVTITLGSTDDMESVEEFQKRNNLCPVTIDEIRCDSSKCKNFTYPSSIAYLSSYCRCCNFPWFFGKVEGDTLHLQRLATEVDSLIVYRDIYLVRRK